MAWDVTTTAEAIGQNLSNIPTIPGNFQPPDALLSIAVVFGALSLLYWLFRPMLERLSSTFQETVFTNWRLALLAMTGLVLSLASGWTTWDGMKNFTNEPLLSFMITFGIQGVMLIIAWLIGESFATGMNQQATRSANGLARRTTMFLGPLVGVFLFVTLALWLMPWPTQPVDGGLGSSTQPSGLSQFGDRLIVLVVGLLAIALVFLYAASDVVKPYIQSTRVVAKNAVLWVMFLSCMATSVFFSFDSLFANIFPQSERVRAAELRAQNQVAGIVADIDQTISTRRMRAVDDLFVSEGWQGYDAQLAKLANVAKESERDVEQFFHDQAEARNRAIKEQQERIVSAQSGQAGLAAKKTALSDELARLKTERPTLAAELAEKKNALDERAKEIDAKRVEAMAEEKGVEGTGKAGRGPEYRARKTELRKLNDYYKIGEERVKDAKKRLDATQTRISKIERELAQVDGDLAKLKGEAQTATQRIQMTQSVSETSEGEIIDPSRMLPAFESARVAFRQEPNAERLGDVQKVCSQVLGAMLTATPTTKDKVKGLDCDPKRASEAASLVFALNVGARTFSANCVGGGKLAANTGTDALFSFAKRCLGDSGLPSQETDALRKKINFIELNRDDKAHRFVVTWNAFGDGNRLAYLALGIAIAIDMLVFMSGLFGANAVRSPLSDVPTVKARSAQQLEAIIENALLPDKFDNARQTLSAMRPITNVEGFMAEVRTEMLDPHARERVLSVLNAGSTIHAVAYDGSQNRYLVRSELFEFLSVVAKKAFEESDHHINQAELEKVIGVALLPNIGANVDRVMQNMMPVTEDSDFTQEIKLGDIDPVGDRKTVRNVLNAAATLDSVRRVGNDPNHYLVHKDLYKTLARIRARALFDGSGHAQLEHRGTLTAHNAQLAQPEPQRTLAAPKAPEPLTEDALTRLTNDYRSFFLTELHLNPVTLMSQLTNDAVREAAADAWQSLEGLGRQNPLLADFLRQVKHTHQRTAESAYNSIRKHVDHDAQKKAQLDAVFSEINSAEAVLLLAPESRLLQTLIGELEQAAERDDGQLPGEQELRDKLWAVAKTLGNLNLDNVESWRQVEERILEPDSQDLPNVVRLHGKNGDPRT